MSEEHEQTPDPVEPEVPVTETPVEQPLVEGSQPTTAQTEGAEVEEATQPPPPHPVPEKVQSDWRDREIARLRTRLREARGNGQQPSEAPPPQLSGQEVEARAQAIAAANEFNRQCNDVAERGRKDFADFDQRIAGLTRLADPNDQVQASQYNSFLVAAIETGEAPKLLHALGGDLNEAARIMALPPVRMAVELTRLAAKEPSEVSNAPKPITPVTRTTSNRSPISPDDPDRADQLPISEWMKRRGEQAKSRGIW